MSKKIDRKPYVNKNNKQLTVTLSKKQLKKADPTIKFDSDLLVSLEVFQKKKK